MAETTPTHLNSVTRYFGGANYRSLLAGAAPTTSTAWGTANLAWFLPFSLPWSYTVQRLFLANGATVNGNIDLGIYSLAGAKLASTGAVAQATVTEVQYVALGSPLVLAAGTYLFGISLSSATGTVSMSASVTPPFGRIMGMFQQATAHPLPTTATLAAWNSTGYPLVGITRTTSGY
jgi:hypothetical protein